MIYDYECPTCGKIFESYNTVAGRHRAPCPNCGNMAHYKFIAANLLGTARAIQIFQPYWDENISDEPVFIETKHQKKDLLKAGGLEEK